jgi:hypothetical protein
LTSLTHFVKENSIVIKLRFTGHVIYEIVRITSPTNQVPVARLALTKPGIRNIGPP